MFKGVFVDDKVEEARYAQYLADNSSDMLSVEFRQPEHEVAQLADHLIEGDFDFAALDFRLDEVPIRDANGQQQRNRYRASALAQQIRDRVIDDVQKDLPLILLSQEDFIKRIFRADTTAEDLFDLVLTKQELVTAEPLQLAITRISSLTKAYKIIKNEIKTNNFIPLTTLLHLDTHESEVVSCHQAIRAIEKLRFPHLIVPKTTRLLIDRPGILLSDAHLLARLAISPDSPDIEKLKTILRERHLAYSGLLCEGWPRWWWHRVDLWAREELGASLGSLPGFERVQKLNAHLGLELKSAVSAWTSTSNEYFWIACTSCDRPSELRHSVLSYDANYQSFLEPSRICWDCVQTGAYETRGLEIDDSDEGLAYKIRNGKIKATQE